MSQSIWMWIRRVYFYPRFIRWENGLVFQIDQILYKCRAASKRWGRRIRYTVQIRGRESYLFQEGASGLLKQRRPDDDFVPEEHRRNCRSRDQGISTNSTSAVTPKIPDVWHEDTD